MVVGFGPCRALVGGDSSGEGTAGGECGAAGPGAVKHGSLRGLLAAALPHTSVVVRRGISAYSLMSDFSIT